VIEERRRAVRRVLLAVAVLLVFAPAADAGGWATVGLSSTPDGAPAGKAWVVDLTILQHGVTPLTDVHPVVTIRNGGESHDFAAQKTGRPGVYRAEVTFPSAGRWSYEIDDGFVSGRPHHYPPVHVGAAAAPVDDAGGPDLAWLLPGIALLALAAVLLAAPRVKTRHRPQAA
jgi:hypothetical protein